MFWFRTSTVSVSPRANATVATLTDVQGHEDPTHLDFSLHLLLFSFHPTPITDNNGYQWRTFFKNSFLGLEI